MDNPEDIFDGLPESEDDGQYLSLGGLIKSYRDFMGWSKEDLGRQAGMADKHILRIETGKIPRPQDLSLERLASAFARHISDLDPAELLQDFMDARDKKPPRFDVDPELKLIGVRLRHYSKKWRHRVYAYINAALDFADEASRHGPK